LAGQDPGFAPGTIRAQLQRILGSEAFDASERNRRFLHYIVEETLAGRADRIKAYSIATSVFGRESSFDPQADPIIRIEASRLRRSLERYYLTAGKEDPVLIAVPKGSYIPAFEVVSGKRPAATALPQENTTAGTKSAGRPAWPWPRLRRFGAEAAILAGLGLIWLGVAWSAGYPPFADVVDEPSPPRHGPAIFVVPFEEDGDQSTHPNLTRGFTREVIVGLTRFNDLFVFGPETSFRYGDDADSHHMVDDLGVDFVLTGGTTISVDHFGVKTSLIDAKTGRYVWSGKFAGTLQAAEVMKVRDEVANQVVQVLAQPYGVIFSNKVRGSEGKAPENLTSYDCVLRFNQYWRTFSRELYGPVRDCLERAVAAEPHYAEALASLSLIYADAYRFEFDDDASAGDPRVKALDLARGAIKRTPTSTRGYLALAVAYWLMNDVDRSLEAAESGFALNPNDTDIMAELGLRYCWRAQWDKGLPLLREAFARNPAQPSAYRLAFFLDHYIRGRYGDALAEAEKIEARSIIYKYIALAMAHAQLGQMHEADAAVKKILAIDPRYGDHVRTDLEKRNLHPDLIQAVVDGLRKAGLAVDGKPPLERS
jgi:TolB-like protein